MLPKVLPIVLIVEDEALVAKVLCHSIERALPGKTTVVHKTDGSDALEFLRSSEGIKVRLCIFDLELPGMSGRELIERTLSQRPDLLGRIAVCTGYTLLSDDSVFDFGCQWLEKPFDLEAVCKMIREAISG